MTPIVCLSTYAALALSVIRVMTMQVKYGSYTSTHDLYIVTGDVCACSVDWLQRVHLD